MGLNSFIHENKIYVVNYPSIDSIIGTRYDITIYRIRTRIEFRKLLSDINLTLSKIADLYYNLHKQHHYPIIHSIIILEELPKAIESRKERLHAQRLDVSRVMMRKGLPSDLVPLVCAYAVPGSKIWEYMKN